MKVKALGAVLAKRFGVEPPAEPLAPEHPTLGDVDSVEALEEYQATKRAYKASLRAALLKASEIPQRDGGRRVAAHAVDAAAGRRRRRAEVDAVRAASGTGRAARRTGR